MSNETPDYTNQWYDAQLPVWEFLSHMLAGQDCVKSLGQIYLPQEPGELAEDYDRRLARSVFFEDYRDCVVNLTGMVFRKPATLNEDVPELIRGREAVKNSEGEIVEEAKEGWAENIDNAGTNLNVFLQRLFQDAFNGHNFIVVERPSARQDIQTSRDEIASGSRPYWVHRKAMDALNWRVAQINGRTVLTQITFRERTIEPDGAFGEADVTRYRVYRLNEQGNAEWQLWEERIEKARNNRKTTVVEMIASDEIRTRNRMPMKRLPIAINYGEYEGFMKSRPPLKGIADINLAVYQKYSDLSNIEHYTCAVTLCLTGVDDTDADRTLGGNCVIALPVNADAKFLSVEGDSIPALERDLEMLQKRMVRKGLDFLESDSHRVPSTATEILLSYSQRTSKLAMMVENIIDCAEEALSITAEMEGLDQGGSLSLGVDETALTLTWEQIRVLSELNERGQLSLQTLWKMLGRADQLPEDFDAETEEKLLLEAAQRQMDMNAKQFDAGMESTP